MRIGLLLVVLAIDLQLLLFFIYALIDWIKTTKESIENIEKWIEKRLPYDTDN